MRRRLFLVCRNWRPTPSRRTLSAYRKLFAPVIPGLTDTAPVYLAYERMREADPTQQTILLFVECQTIGEFREALHRLPFRKSSEWRDLDDGHLEFVL